MPTRAELLDRHGLRDNPAHIDPHQSDSGDWAVRVRHAGSVTVRVNLAVVVRLVSDLRKIKEYSLADRFEAAADNARRNSLRGGTHEDYVARRLSSQAVHPGPFPQKHGPGKAVLCGDFLAGHIC